MADDELHPSVAALEARMARMEATLDRIDAALQQVPAVVATVTDTADAFISRTSPPLPEERLMAVGQVVERLSDPAVAGRLAAILDRVEALDGATALLAEGPAAAAMVTDMIDERLGQVVARGVDVDARVAHLGRLLEKATEPDRLVAVERLLDRAPQLIPLLEQLDALPGHLATLGDTADDLMARAQARGFDLDALVRGWLDISILAGRLFNSPEFLYHVERGVFSPGAVHMVSQAGEAMSQARAKPAEPAGPFKALSALRDPDVQRALGFGLEVARLLGRSLKEPLPASAQLTDKER